MTSFTLAEVLIVLGIIGLIADMTIPTLHQNITDKTTVVKLKKGFSTFDSAMRMATNQEGTIEGWNLSGSASSEGAEEIGGKLMQYINAAKYCGAKSEGCFPDLSYKQSNGGTLTNFETNNSFAKIKMSDGMLAAIQSRGSCASGGNSQQMQKICGYLFIDINGEKKPNQVGTDIFNFRITTTGIVPSGNEQDYNYTFATCKNASGYGCTAWVLYNENLDYLKCDGLSWEGKKSCK